MARNFSRKFKRIKRDSANSEMMTKFRAIMRKRYVRWGIAVLAIVCIVTAIYLYNRFYKYDSYKVLRDIKIEGGYASKYTAFGEFAVKYSNNGISYIDGNETVWDESQEMKTPLIDVCNDYLALTDKNTNKIFVYDEEGRKGTITTSYPVVSMEVAEQGVVAAMLEDKKANYIEVYDKEGKRLVSHKTLIDENGFPLRFTISDEGTKMAVSYVTVTNGAISNKVVFYDFSDSEKKDSADRASGTFDHYQETIVPTVEFVNDEDAIAVGENILSIYSVGKKPKLEEEISFKDEIQKVFYNEEYVGLVFKNTNSNEPFRIEVYDLKGNRIIKSNIDMQFDSIDFSGDNVLMYNDMNCRIISLKGVEKFRYTFKEQISGIIPVDGSKTFLLMKNSAIEKIRLE